MNSYLTEDFVARFGRLPDPVKRQARKTYRVWKKNPHYPSLHIKKVHAREPIYSVRIGQAMGLVEGDTIAWFWIGSHSDYDTLLSRL